MYRQKLSRAEVFGHVGAWIRTLGCFEDYPELNVSDFYIDVLSDKHVGIVGNGVAGKKKNYTH